MKIVSEVCAINHPVSKSVEIQEISTSLNDNSAAGDITILSLAIRINRNVRLKAKRIKPFAILESHWVNGNLWLK